MIFEPVSLDMQHDYNRLLRATPRIASDYSFANIYGWAEEYGLEIALENNMAWIRQKRPSTVYWAPVGNWGDADWEKEVTRLPGQKTIVRIPDELAGKWRKQIPKMNIQSARDHWDYLYSVRELIELKGNRFHKKKNLLNQFVRNYDYTYVDLKKKYIDKALALQTEWCLWKECNDSAALEAENHVIVRIFSQWDEIQGLFGAGLMVGADMVAYTVAETLPDNSLVIHFEKGCPGYKGVYQAINKLFLENSAQGFETVNREQDLGDKGLKKAKESYNPIGYLKKYTAELKS